MITSKKGPAGDGILSGQAKNPEVRKISKIKLSLLIHGIERGTFTGEGKCVYHYYTNNNSEETQLYPQFQRLNQGHLQVYIL